MQIAHDPATFVFLGRERLGQQSATSARLDSQAADDQEPEHGCQHDGEQASVDHGPNATVLSGGTINGKTNITIASLVNSTARTTRNTRSGRTLPNSRLFRVGMDELCVADK